MTGVGQEIEPGQGRRGGVSPASALSVEATSFAAGHLYLDHADVAKLVNAPGCQPGGVVIAPRTSSSLVVSTTEENCEVAQK